MDEIIPRWEWRTFGRKIDTFIDVAAYPLSRHVESSEIYIASANPAANPKIRDEKIDIKALQQIDANRLEQWVPVLKASFPLSVEQVSAVYRALKLDAPPGAGGCDFDSFMKMIGADLRIRAVAVDKKRNQYVVDGCTVEVSDICFDGEVFRTVAAEDPDPAIVWATVGLLGLQDRENMNYVKAIERIKAGRLT